MDGTFRSQAMKPRIALIHSEVRSYRVPIFELLHKEYDVQFYFMEGKRRAKNFSQTQSWNYQDLRPLPMIGYSSDFSPRLILKLIRTRKTTDLILSSGLASFATHVSFLLSKILRKKFVLWTEDWAWPKNLVGRLSLSYIKYIVRGSHACVAAGTKSSLFLEALGASREKIFLAPNSAIDLSKIPIDQSKLQRLRQHINPQKKIIISYLGRIVRYKGLDLLLRAFAELEKQRKNILLMIIGDGPFAPFCRNLMQDLRIRHIYWPQAQHLTGKNNIEAIPHHEFINYFRISDLFVLPGRFVWKENNTSESWGLVLNEALSLGLPCVSSSSVAAAFDLLEPSFIMQENNWKDLATVLASVLSQPLPEVGKRQHDRFKSTVGFDKMMAGFTSAIHHAMTSV